MSREKRRRWPLVLAAVGIGLCLCVVALGVMSRLGLLEPEPPEYASGGLGLREEDWQHGGDDAFSMMAQGGRVQYIERAFDEPLPLDEARAVGTGLMPADAVLVETYSPAGFPELVVDLYVSESLKSRFGENAWIGGEPGQFIAIYGVFDEKVPRVILGTGNHP